MRSSNAWLEKADLRKADFSGGKLYRAKMEYVDLRVANFTGADLSNVRLRGTSLKGAKLIDARFSIQKQTVFAFKPFNGKLTLRNLLLTKVLLIPLFCYLWLSLSILPSLVTLLYPHLISC